MPLAAADPDAETEAAPGSEVEIRTGAGLAKSVCERNEDAEAR